MFIEAANKMRLEDNHGADGVLKMSKGAVTFPRLVGEVADMVVDAQRGFVPPSMLILNVDADPDRGQRTNTNGGSHWVFVMYRVCSSLSSVIATANVGLCCF